MKPNSGAKAYIAAYSQTPSQSSFPSGWLPSQVFLSFSSLPMLPMLPPPQQQTVFQLPPLPVPTPPASSTAGNFMEMSSLSGSSNSMKISACSHARHLPTFRTTAPPYTHATLPPTTLAKRGDKAGASMELTARK